MGGDIEEYPFIFMNTPASLQILASVEMALMVWRCKYANTSHLFERPRLIFFEQNFSCNEVLVVPVPHRDRIEAQIDEKIASIGLDLRKWIYFHSDRDFLDADSTDAFLKCFKHIVADFSGSIGGKASAINILNAAEFSDVVNYIMACTYCLEDQVKRFWPSVASESQIDVNSEDEEDDEESYWKDWIKSGGNSITDTESAKRLAKKSVSYGNYTAFDYFSKMLPSHERVSEFIWLLLEDDRYHPGVLHSLLFRTLDRVQAEEVFKKQASSIYSFLMKSGKNFRCAHQLWTLMGHLILENESEFYMVVFELWLLVSIPQHPHGLNYTQCGEVNNLLWEIWSHASDELKAYVSNSFLSDKLLDFSEFPNKFPKPTCYGHDVTFILEITSRLRNSDKEQWWLENWCDLALRSKLLYLEQFMRICLPNDDEIELFKNEITAFGDLFKSLIEEGFYSDLKDYLVFCSKDAEQFQQLGKKVLGSNLNLILFQDDDQFSKFDWFVSEVFANVQKDVEEFKMLMISSPKCLKCLLAARQADRISSNDFSRLVNRFVTDEGELLQQVKRKLFEHCRIYPLKCTAETFNADHWQEFLEWCTANHEEISAFKSSLDVDVIFLKRLKDYLDGKCYVGGLDFLDSFLKWYFDNEEGAKNFKLEIVKNYKEIDILRVEVEKNCIYVEGLLHKLLVWLFDNNTENASVFFKTCNIDIRHRAIHFRERTYTDYLNDCT